MLFWRLRRYRPGGPDPQRRVTVPSARSGDSAGHPGPPNRPNGDFFEPTGIRVAAVIQCCRPSGERAMNNRWKRLVLAALVAATAAAIATVPAAPAAGRVAPSDEHALDAAAVGPLDVTRHPVGSQQLAGHLDDDVIGAGAGVVVEPGQPLQA
jgi:hypothetical protein